MTSAGCATKTNPVLAEKPRNAGISASIPADNDQLKSFQWCIDWLSDVDPYSGLIVSMHAPAFGAGVTTLSPIPTMNAARSLASGIEEFIAANEDRQAKVRAGPRTKARFGRTIT